MLKSWPIIRDRFLGMFPANPRGNCLPRSLMLFRLARLQWLSRGYSIVGVRRSDTELDGHAWLSLDGHPFLEHTRQHEHMAKTVTFPAE